jgi:hypothetical protein
VLLRGTSYTNIVICTPQDSQALSPGPRLGAHVCHLHLQEGYKRRVLLWVVKQRQGVARLS